MVPKRTLQPGLSSLVVIPKDQPLLKYKDCFYNFPIHSDDHKHFIFFIPSFSHKAPMLRFQWTVSVDQGVSNSPTIYQYFVNIGVYPHERFPYLLHGQYSDSVF